MSRIGTCALHLHTSWLTHLGRMQKSRRHTACEKEHRTLVPHLSLVPTSHRVSCPCYYYCYCGCPACPRFPSQQVPRAEACEQQDVSAGGRAHARDSRGRKGSGLGPVRDLCLGDGRRPESAKGVRRRGEAGIGARNEKGIKKMKEGAVSRSVDKRRSIWRLVLIRGGGACFFLFTVLAPHPCPASLEGAS